MTLVLTFVAMLLLVAGMAVGVIFGRKPIAGSCGGMKALGLDMECEVCGGDPQRCDAERGPGVSRSAGKGGRVSPGYYDPSETSDSR